MDDIAFRERRAFERWHDYRALQALANRFSTAPRHRAVTEPGVLKRLGAPRNTRAEVVHRLALECRDRARAEAGAMAVLCFSAMSGLQHPLGRTLDVRPEHGSVRRLLLDEIFVVTKPHARWSSSSQYELVGPDLDANLVPVRLQVTGNDVFIDTTP